MCTDIREPEGHELDRCVYCGANDWVPVQGSDSTGIVAPDGYRETAWFSGWRCRQCGNVEEDD